MHNKHHVSVTEFLDQYVFSGGRQGAFVEVGSFDGVTENITNFFEAERGWVGHCIEAAPTNFEMLARSRNAECHQLCIADSDTPVWFHSSGRYSGILDNSYWEIASLDYTYPCSENTSRVMPVRLRRFFNTFLPNDFSTNLLCVYDTGNQADILRSMGFQQPLPNVIVVSNSSGKYSDYVYRLMIEHRYSLIQQIGNFEIYVFATLLDNSLNL